MSVAYFFSRESLQAARVARGAAVHTKERTRKKKKKKTTLRAFAKLIKIINNVRNITLKSVRAFPVPMMSHKGLVYMMYVVEGPQYIFSQINL